MQVNAEIKILVNVNTDQINIMKINYRNVKITLLLQFIVSLQSKRYV